MSTASTFMHSVRRYRVVAPVIVVAINGRDQYLSRGVFIPVEVGPAVTEHLERAGLIEPVESTEEAS